MKRVYQILGMTPAEYEQMFLTSYLHWCENIATDLIETQKIISNNPISKWYKMEYDKCEAEFLKLVGRYENHDTVTVDDKIVCYCECTERMNNISPKPLIHAAKSENKSKRMPVQGIKTFCYN